MPIRARPGVGRSGNGGAFAILSGAAATGLTTPASIRAAAMAAAPRRIRGGITSSSLTLVMDWCRTPSMVRLRTHSIA